MYIKYAGALLQRAEVGKPLSSKALCGYAAFSLKIKLGLSQPRSQGVLTSHADEKPNEHPSALSGVPKGGGNGGSGPPTFQKVGPLDSHENVIKLVGGGSGRSVKKWSLRFLKSKQRIACVPDHLKRKDFSSKWSGTQASKELFFKGW